MTGEWYASQADARHLREILEEKNVKMEDKLPDVTRVVLVDHRSGGDYATRGRVFDVQPLTVQLSVQDQGRTLKVFVTDRKEGEEDG